MREIKFLLWDRINKKLYYSFALSFTESGTTIASVKTDEGYDKDFVIGESGELIQFTGNKGKHRAEIWDGSIVQFRESSGWDEKKERETFKKTVWRVGWDRYRWHLFNARGESWDNGLAYEDYSDIFEWEKLKVIGHINENPELLK